jgi:two-component system KDP operon response regulator KdpE
MRILVVEDEEKVASFIRKGLEEEHYAVDVALDGEEGLLWAQINPYDLIVLDLMLPKLDGFRFLDQLREDSIGTPVLVLTARDTTTDKVRGLDLGADDYLTKPFGVEEMLARVRAALRRTAHSEATPGPPLIVEDLEIDFAARRVTVRGHVVQLTPTEYSLLAHLALNAGRVLTHRALLQAVWGPEYGTETEYLWAYVRRLRRKIELEPSNPSYILTQPGVGYTLVVPP